MHEHFYPIREPVDRFHSISDSVKLVGLHCLGYNKRVGLHGTVMRATGAHSPGPSWRYRSTDRVWSTTTLNTVVRCCGNLRAGADSFPVPRTSSANRHVEIVRQRDSGVTSNDDDAIRRGDRMLLMLTMSTYHVARMIRDRETIIIHDL